MYFFNTYFSNYSVTTAVVQTVTLTALLEAYDEQDGDAARRMLRAPFIRSMDVEYSKLARDMDTPATKVTSHALHNNYILHASFSLIVIQSITNICNYNFKFFLTVICYL